MVHSEMIFSRVLEYSPIALYFVYIVLYLGFTNYQISDEAIVIHFGPIPVKKFHFEKVDELCIVPTLSWKVLFFIGHRLGNAFTKQAIIIRPKGWFFPFPSIITPKQPEVYLEKFEQFKEQQRISQNASTM